MADSVKKKYVTITRCQARCDDGKIRFFPAGKIAFFAKEPPAHCFILAEKSRYSTVDFNVVPEEVLRDETIIDLNAIIDYIRERFGEDYENFTRNEVVDALISLRNAPPELLSATDSTVPTAAEFKNKTQVDGGSGISVEVSGETPEDLTDGVDDLEDLLDGD